MLIPAKIKVGHLVVDVIEMDQKEADSIGADGLFSYRHATMRINVEQHPSQLVETLLHECLHALWAVAGFNARDEEEDIVTRLTPLLLTLFLDNPSLFDMIDEHLFPDWRVKEKVANSAKLVFDIDSTISKL